MLLRITTELSNMLPIKISLYKKDRSIDRTASVFVVYIFFFDSYVMAVYKCNKYRESLVFLKFVSFLEFFDLII